MDLKSGNPALSAKTFDGLSESSDPMTLSGTINKTAILLVLLLCGAGWVWNLFFFSHDLEAVRTYLNVGASGGFIIGVVTSFNKRISPLHISHLRSPLEGIRTRGSLRALGGEAPRHCSAGSRAHLGHSCLHARSVPL